MSFSVRIMLLSANEELDDTMISLLLTMPRPSRPRFLVFESRPLHAAAIYEYGVFEAIKVKYVRGHCLLLDGASFLLSSMFSSWRLVSSWCAIKSCESSPLICFIWSLDDGLESGSLVSLVSLFILEDASSSDGDLTTNTLSASILLELVHSSCENSCFFKLPDKILSVVGN